jgi:3-dehydroquinate dehydratase-1
VIIKSRTVAVLGKNAARDVLAAGEADMVELRLDLVDNDPVQSIKALRAATSKPIIATNRLKSEGGSFEGSERERIELLLSASDYADYVDIELQAELRAELMGRANMPVIVSYHDFQGMPAPGDMERIFEEMQKTGAAIAKIAVTPFSLRDNLKILQFLIDADKMPLCMIAMGQIGRHLRAVAPLYGSAMTYGYVTQSTAPGQMSISELCQARRLLEGASR